MVRKPTFKTARVTVGGRAYSVICRVTPARSPVHASADSPRFLEPGAPMFIQVIRILWGAEDITDELTYHVRWKIEEAAKEQLRLGGRRTAKTPEDAA